MYIYFFPSSKMYKQQIRFIYGYKFRLRYKTTKSFYYEAVYTKFTTDARHFCWTQIVKETPRQTSWLLLGEGDKDISS